jgi:hypothetical protein
MATEWLHKNHLDAEAQVAFSQVLPGEIEAPRVGLEPTTNGLTVTPRASVQSRLVSFGVVLSDFSPGPCCSVMPCAAWYGYTYGYTRSAVRSP